MAKKPKGASVKGSGDPVRETPRYVEPDQHGTRQQRRAWQRLYGSRERPAGPVAGEEPPDGQA